MAQNDSNPGMVERSMDDSTGGRSEGERLSDRENMVGKEGMAGAGSGADNSQGTVERGERQAETAPDRHDGSYGNDTGFSGAGTEGERPAPGRTENGGIASDDQGNSRDF
jgi:hypothetical protein